MRRLIIAIIAVLILSTAACSGAIAGRGTPAPPPALIPADTVAFRVTYGPGLSPELFYLTMGPALSVYGDGRVFVAHLDYPGIPQLEVGQIEPIDVARFVADARDGGLVNEGKDYGDPVITDAGSTAVELDDGSTKHEVTVYALETRSGLSLVQGGLRDALEDLIDRAYDLAVTSPATPERVRVVQSEPSELDPATVPWPGPDPSTFMTGTAPMADQCGVLEGPAAATVYEAAVDNEVQEWLVNGVPSLLAVRPLHPDEIGCDE